MIDIQVVPQGSLSLLYPATDVGNEWIESHLNSPEVTWYGWCDCC